MSELLVEEDIEKWQNAHEIVKFREAMIINRMDYIIKTIFKAFDLKIDYWFAYDDNEDLSNSFYINDKVVWYDMGFSGKTYRKNDPTAILKDGREWDFDNHEFPRRWLFEDFEQELIDGKVSYLKAKEDKDKLEKENLIKQKLEHEELIKTAKSKLSKEEYDALKKTCVPSKS